MPFAINQHGGWRAVDNASNLIEGEAYSDVQPSIAIAPVVPQEVTRYQALAALHLAGRIDVVKAMMADTGTDTLTVLAFDNAQSFKRDSQMVLYMATKLGWTDEQVDDLFIAAGAIK